MTATRRWWKRVLFAVPFFTPKGFLLRAGILTFAYLVCHLAGLRQYTSILSGTPAQAGISRELAGVLAAVYLLFYCSFVTVVPILTLAAGVFHLFEWLMSRRAKAGTNQSR